MGKEVKYVDIPPEKAREAMLGTFSVPHLCPSLAFFFVSFDYIVLLTAQDMVCRLNSRTRCWSCTLSSRLGRSPILSATHACAFLLAVPAHHCHSWANNPNDSVKKILGRDARTFEQYVADHVALFK